MTRGGDPPNPPRRPAGVTRRHTGRSPRAFGPGFAAGNERLAVARVRFPPTAPVAHPGPSAPDSRPVTPGCGGCWCRGGLVVRRGLRSGGGCLGRWALSWGTADVPCPTHPLGPRPAGSQPAGQAVVPHPGRRPPGLAGGPPASFPAYASGPLSLVRGRKGHLVRPAARAAARAERPGAGTAVSAATAGEPCCGPRPCRRSPASRPGLGCQRLSWLDQPSELELQPILPAGRYSPVE